MDELTSAADEFEHTLRTDRDHRRTVLLAEVKTLAVWAQRPARDPAVQEARVERLREELVRVIHMEFAPEAQP
jgi:hypothetical protein